MNDFINDGAGGNLLDYDLSDLMTDFEGLVCNPCIKSNDPVFVNLRQAITIKAGGCTNPCFRTLGEVKL